MSNAPPPFEYQKWAHEINRQDAQRAHDRLGDFFQSVNESAVRGGDAALRAALLINGGAAVSVLAFIGGLAAQDRIKLDQLKGVAGSLGLFAFGVVAAVLGMGFAYFTNYTVAAQINSYERLWEQPYVKPGKNTFKIRLAKYAFHTVAILAALASVTLFIWGVFDVQRAISGFK